LPVHRVCNLSDNHCQQDATFNGKRLRDNYLHLDPIRDNKPVETRYLGGGKYRKPRLVQLVGIVLAKKLAIDFFLF